ncbi:glutamate--tRNA ligase [Candidatus Woesearchaeota archaeon]|nr:glutamate--tRNA ligase [Candidatus Woesearchaeota archaeon]
MDFEAQLYKYALQNAVRFNGTANEKTVVGRLLSESEEARKKIDEIRTKAQEVCVRVNAMSQDAQAAELKKVAPELLEESRGKKHEERDIFAFLGIRPGEYVATAFPPEPSKYPHIGHAKAIMLNYLLARKHEGKFYLRFEDTNPELAEKEFYDIHLDNYSWLGIEPDIIDNASNHMEEFSLFADQLIKKGKAYVCTCPTEIMRENRAKGMECACRKNELKKIQHLWQDMFLMKEGEAVLRMKIDLTHQNTTMRDPVLMRIIEKGHPLTGRRYRVWPTYDFENSIMDGLQKITHRLRSKEFELRNELQRHIQLELGFDQTKIFEFARFNMEGVESSGRIIRDKIKNGELVGWDDPSLTTLVALRRRGFVPDAIKNFIVNTGITKAEATLTWDDLIVQNRRILDSSCNRYFFIDDPVEIHIRGAPDSTSHLKLHPDYPNRGTRDLITHSGFLLSRNDFQSLEDNALYRLMDCLNFTRKGNDFSFHSKEVEKYKTAGKKIMHWLPAADGLVDVTVMMPDKVVRSGKAEPMLKNVKVNEIVQFERFGFCRLDSIGGENGQLNFWYTHK